MTPQIKSNKLPPPQDLDKFISGGKLSLRLQDAILLALENNSNIRIAETQVETQKFVLLGTYKPFDPLVQSVVNANRYSYPGYTQLQGVGDGTNSTQDVLTQSFQVSYSQTFSTGTSFTANIGSIRTSTNSSFYFYNPYYNSTVGLQFTQPLLRNAGRFVTTAPLVIARSALQQSRATFQTQVNNAILQVVSQYWAVVQARGSFEVQHKSLDAADASYQHDKRALELGALPPLDIYRSQAEVAARRLVIIQAEYTLKQTQEALRLTVGADQDPSAAALDFDLTESPAVADATADQDADMLTKALASRPEIAAADIAVANDDLSVRVARNGLKPDLSLSGFYQSSGAGGNVYDLNDGHLVTPGGLGSSFNQTFGFGFPGYGGSLTLNLPLRNRAAKANLGTALVARHHDQLSGQATREQIVSQVHDAIYQLDEARLALKAGESSLDLAQKSLAADQRKFELGAETNFFVLDSQTKLAQAEVELLQAQINYQVAHATVDYTTGDLLKNYNVKIAELSK
ncbi:outer membrane protein TolC [Granulicella aggregans]|uniref:Outer membrane protein TolC n=1 Tax=Granulicella aggregans TaxID=474949 RepID=A0A7W8E6Y4_9BACT|nr:TolC family protein [Granulicella aggregans]MBB5061141.1 outer membrane protein TolC [Granulicella aggregans]